MSSDHRSNPGNKKALQKPKAFRKLAPGTSAVSMEAIQSLGTFEAGDEGANTRAAASSVSPDDFASALQKSIDDLQARLASLTNPITNFAVKEFRLEVPVVISVSKLGTFSYRFVGPGETVDSSRITRLSLTIVPIEKQSSAGSLPPALFTPDVTLDSLAGLDSGSVEILRQNQIHTIGDLSRVTSRASARAELEALLKVDRVKLSNLLSEAELLLIRGIGPAEAQVLLKIGVKSLSDLSKLTPQELLQKLNQAGGKKETPMQLAVAEAWIKAARSYVGVSNVTSQISVDAPVINT